MAKDLLFKAAKIVTPPAQSNVELAQKQAVGGGPHGGTKGFQRRERLHASRPRQKVAVDLVKPMPKTTKGNRWIWSWWTTLLGGKMLCPFQTPLVQNRYMQIRVLNLSYS